MTPERDAIPAALDPRSEEAMRETAGPAWLYLLLDAELHAAVRSEPDDVASFVHGGARFVADASHPIATFQDGLVDEDGALVGLEIVAASPFALARFADVRNRRAEARNRGLRLTGKAAPLVLPGLAIAGSDRHRGMENGCLDRGGSGDDDVMRCVGPGGGLNVERRIGAPMASHRPAAARAGA